MARVKVPTHWFVHGVMPDMCARHGAPATGLTRRTLYTRTPGWAWWFILVGLLVVAIVSLAVRQEVKGQISTCDRCTAERRRFLNRRRTGWAVAVLLPLAAWGLYGVGVEAGPLIAIWFLAFPAALIFGFCGDCFRPAGYLTKDKAWVQLKRVSDEFARAVDLAVSGATPPPAPAPPRSPWSVGAAGTPR